MGKTSGTEALKGINCPECNSCALYKYGKTKNGKQRFICLICGRQFTPEATRKAIKNKPICTNCGGQMHLYKRSGALMRFRCSNYPACRTYIKKAANEMPSSY